MSKGKKETATADDQRSETYDFLIIGSGFGGSVSALRLAEKGYRVAVLEMGKRYRTGDFPKNNWVLWKHLWFPFFRFFGILKLTLFRHVFILSGTGVGGGSLVYGNTLKIPAPDVFKPIEFLSDFDKDLAPFYRTAEKMLGVSKNPHLEDADLFLKDVATHLGQERFFESESVGVFFGKPGEKVQDPYFQGKGPERTGCTFCGGCFIGCRVGAKNTLDMNYLYLAERLGCGIFPETKVSQIKPKNMADLESGYLVTTRRSTRIFSQRKTFTAKNVILSAGTLGTVELLLKSKERGDLPLLSPILGTRVRTNAEAILGLRQSQKNFSKGLAIASGFPLNNDTHIELCRYPAKSNALSLLCAPLVFPKKLKHLFPWDWAKETAILLVMQTRDSFLSLSLNKWGRLKTTTTAPKELTVKGAKKLLKNLAEKFQATPLVSIPEWLLRIPTTAHILGGAPMGKNTEDGVINSFNQIFHYPGLYVCDGSMIPVNLGVNPSLSITALTERAMSFIPPKGEL